MFNLLKQRLNEDARHYRNTPMNERDRMSDMEFKIVIYGLLAFMIGSIIVGAIQKLT